MLEEVKENISYNVLNIMTLGNGKGQDNKFKSFLKQTSLAFIKTFCGKWKEETLPKWFFISKKLEKCQNESWQSKFHKFLQTFTRFLHVVFYTIFTRFLHAVFTGSNVPCSSSKKESVIILKMKNFWNKILAIFYDRL